MQELLDRSHITEEMWIALKQDTMEPEQLMQVFAHTASCTYCAGRLALTLEAEAEEIKPPAYLSEQIFERVKQLDVQAVTVVKQTSKRLQLLLYGMKVGAAVVFSIFLLVVTANFQGMEASLPRPFVQTEARESVPEAMNRAANGVTDWMNEFANQLLNGGKQG